jgi:hypothetical protein
MNSVAVIAGSISTALFVASALPMLYKAARTKELGSYSLGNLTLANIGNGFYTVYVLSLPVGPVWALHGFYLASSALMLLWYLRYKVGSKRGWRLRERDDRRTIEATEYAPRTGATTRLVKVKRRYDPTSPFQINHNMPPC